MTPMTNTKNTRILLGALAALGVSALWTPIAHGASYTLAPNDGTSQQDWNTSATWGGSGTPGSAAGDTASASGAFGGVSQTVDISAPLANGLATLTLGDTSGTGVTTIKSDNSTPLLMAATSASITSTGADGAVNVISAPVSLSGGLVVNGPGSAVVSSVNVPLSILGKIAPTASGNRTIENLSKQTLTLGDIDLSTGATGSVATIRAGTTSLATSTGSNIVLGGTIADGSSGASGLTLGARYSTTLGGSYIQIDGTNTYTGATTLGLQGNTNTLFRINSDQPFGPAASGNLTIGSSAYANTLEAVGQDRVIAKNSTTINRSIVFQGDHSLTISATTLNMSNAPSTGNVTIGVLGFINNNVTAPGKTVTLGVAGGNINLNGSNTGDLYRLRDVTGAGTTIIASNIADNSGVVPANSKMVIKQNGTGTLVLTGTNTYQGGTRIGSTGTVQLGDGGTSGALLSGNGLVPVVNGTAAGTLAFNRSDAVSTPLTANGPINLVQKGSGSVTLTNSQFHSGSTAVGDGLSASKLVVQGGLVSSASTSVNATVAASVSGQLQLRTVTLGGADTVATLGIKAGQPVYVTGSGASALNYIDAITGPNTFTVWGEVGTLLAGGSAALTFGEGSALGTSAAVTTVSNLSTLAGTGAISGSVNALAGSFLAPGENDGEAGTLSTGALTLTGSTLDFDLAATAAGTSDLIAATGTVSFSSLTFNFDALTAGVLETGVAYDLVSGTSDLTGDVNLISTTFGSGLDGLYVPTYSMGSDGGLNYITVTFAAVPEPASFALLAGMATLGGCLVRRRRSHRG